MTPSQAQNLIPGESKILLDYTGGFKRIRLVVGVEREVWETFSGIKFCWVHIEHIKEIHGRIYRELHTVPSHKVRAIY